MITFWIWLLSKKKNICFEWKIFLFSLLPKEQSLVEVMETLGSDEVLPSAKLLPMKMKINTFSSLKENKFLSFDSTRTLIAVCQMTSNKKKNNWFLKKKYFFVYGKYWTTSFMGKKYTFNERLIARPSLRTKYDVVRK